MLIGNDCLTSFIYNRYKQHYDHPFVFCTILPKNFISLLENFYSIDFNNIRVYPMIESKDFELYCDRYSLVKKNYEHLYCIMIDDKVEVTFIHHMQDPAYDNPTKIGSEVYYKDIKSLLTDNWRRRVMRMNMNNVTFMYNVKDSAKVSDVQQIANFHQYRKIVFLKTSQMRVVLDDHTTLIHKYKIKERVRMIANRMLDENFELFFPQKQ